MTKTVLVMMEITSSTSTETREFVLK